MADEIRPDPKEISPDSKGISQEQRDATDAAYQDAYSAKYGVIKDAPGAMSDTEMLEYQLLRRVADLSKIFDEQLKNLKNKDNPLEGAQLLRGGLDLSTPEAKPFVESMKRVFEKSEELRTILNRAPEANATAAEEAAKQTNETLFYYSKTAIGDYLGLNRKNPLV